MRKRIIAAAVLACAGWVGSAQASLVTVWDYSVATAWSGATFTSGGGAQTVNASQISWGNPTGNLNTNPNGERSGLLISASPFTGQITTDSFIPSPTQTITHVNNPISGDFATLLTAGLSTTLTLTPFSPAGAPLDPFKVDFSVDFRETSNAAPCGFPVVTVCDDIFVISFGSLNNVFIYEGVEYFTSIVPLNNSLITLPAATCAAAGKPAGCLGFTTPESAATAVPFGFLITSREIEIPEPGALGLVGVALFAAGLARRTRRG